MLNQNGIPQIFGLAAIQIYIAFLIQKDDEYSKRESGGGLRKEQNFKAPIWRVGGLKDRKLWKKIYFPGFIISSIMMISITGNSVILSLAHP